MTATLVFDWNGTLLDDADALISTINIILQQYRRPAIGHEAFRDICSFPFTTLYQKLGFSPDEIEELHADGSAIFHENYERLAADAPLRLGADALLMLARNNGIQSLILSNHVVDAIEVQLRRLRIHYHFDHILAFASRETQYKDISKGERLRLYMQDANIKPESTFIIGDTIEECDIARQLNLISVAITGGVVSESRLRAANPDYIIHDFYELTDIIREHLSP